MGTGKLTTVINYTLGLPASQQMLKLINFNANTFNISPKQILVYSQKFLFTDSLYLLNHNNNEQFITKKQHTFTLNTRTTFLPMRQIQLYWLDSGSLNSNLADGEPTLFQSKAVALYGTDYL